MTQYQQSQITHSQHTDTQVTDSASSNLADCQQLFAQALQYKNNAEQLGINSNSFSAEMRIQIYRNNFIVSLSEVLAATYPVLHTVVGETCFMQIARKHVLDNPLQSGDVQDYGVNFSKTLQHFPRVISQVPYAIDITDLEWAIETYRLAANKNKTNQQALLGLNKQPLANLALVDEQEHSMIQLLLPANKLLWQSQYALFDLFKKLQLSNEKQCQESLWNNFEINQSQSGLIEINNFSEHQYYPLPVEEYQLLQSLQQLPLGQIPSEQLQHLDQILQRGWISEFINKNNQTCGDN